MNIKELGLIAVVIIIVIIILYVVNKIVKSKKRQTISEHYREENIKINETYDELVGELERTRKISKNEESIKLYNSWLVEFEKLNEKKVDIDALIAELNDYVETNEHSNFLLCNNELEGKIFKFREDLENLFKKVKQYTNYELENTRISLTLKDRIRDLSATFEQKLEFLEIYNRSFFEEVTSAQALIAEFENLQKNGDYPEGRSILKECNRKIDKIDFILKVILNFHEYLSQLDNDIIMMAKIGDEITKIGFSLNIKDFKAKVKGFSIDREEILVEIAQIDFENSIDKERLKTLELRINELDQNITEFKDIVEEKFNFIKEIIEIIGKNDQLLTMADDLITKAIEEKNLILSLYELPEIRQIKKLEEEVERFDNFKADYNKLMDIIHNAKEDFVALRRRIDQSNSYLIKLMKNIELAVRELKSIRNDEILTREKISAYQKTRIDIDLYLRKYNHLTMMSNELSSLIVDLDIKLANLIVELEKEPLSISEVRKLNQGVEKLIEAITTDRLDRDVKQRMGAKLLIEYVSRYNTSEEINLTIKRLHSSFNSHEYKRVLRETHEMLVSLSSNGEMKYSRVVANVVVAPFEPVVFISEVQADEEESIH